MNEDDIVYISFDIFEKKLLEVYNNSSLKLGYLFSKDIGLDLIEADYESDYINILKFKIVDKEKWFLSKIKYGF